MLDWVQVAMDAQLGRALHEAGTLGIWLSQQHLLQKLGIVSCSASDALCVKVEACCYLELPKSDLIGHHLLEDMN